MFGSSSLLPKMIHPPISCRALVSKKLNSIPRLMKTFFLKNPRKIFYLILGLSLLALAGGQAAEIFEIESIPGSLLRLQTQAGTVGKTGNPLIFVNNLDMESLVALARRPAQVVAIQHSGPGYAVWNHAPAGPDESLEMTMNFITTPISKGGSLMFGGYCGDKGLERLNSPTVRFGLNTEKKLAVSYGGFAKNDWKELPHPPLKIGKTYRVSIRIHSDAHNGQGIPLNWDVRLLDGANVIASVEQIPIAPGLITPFSGVFLQSNAGEPLLVEKVTFGGSKRSLVEADFQTPNYSSNASLVGQGGWTGSAPEKVQVVESATAMAPYITAKPDFRVYLSKDRYPAEDVHLDAVCVLPFENAQVAESVLDLQLRSKDGQMVAEKKGIVPPSSQFAVYWSFPPAVIGREVELQAVVRNKKGGEGDKVQIPFSVDAARVVVTQGEIALHVPGGDKLAGAVIPYSVGVPFPEGALSDTGRLRLVDENGAEVPASFRLDGRWSRFGSVRWVNCSFSLPVPRQAVKLKLQYGVGERGSPILPPTAPVPWDGKFAGGDFQVSNVVSSRGAPLLQTASLSGSYVIDGTGKSFTVNPSQKFMVEQSDSQQTILRQQGWYEAADKTRFCQYDNRITLFKNSPLMRVEHAWTFTGDGNQDTISEMGWRFSAAGEFGSGAFWKPGGDLGEWFSGQSLLQYGFGNAALKEVDKETELDLRSEGIGRLSAGKSKPDVLFGVKDFWQNYPAEVTWDKAGYSVLTWPRNGRADPTEVSLGKSYLLKFIHTGKNLSFRLPEPYLVEPIYHGSERHYLAGKVESANAQGISKTTEMWVKFGGAAEAGALIHALCDRSLSAYIDPEWLAASGVFHEIHTKDTEEFPREEAVYESVALAPERWAERMSVYGKWIWGGVLSMPDLKKQVVMSNFRAYRKAHQGWPYSWLPYARSGDVRFRQFAEASTRNMADVNFCHYSDERMPRQLGFWNRSLIPWTFVYGPTTRHYADKVDFLWHAWHLAGDYRARETAGQWAEATKTDKMPILPWSGNRRSINMLKTYVDEYQETLDPWFIPAYREVAALHKQMAVQSGNPNYSLGGASFWNTGPREYLRFTGDPAYLPLYLNRTNYWGSESCNNVWIHFGVVMLEPLSFAYRLTRNPYYAERIRGQLDWAEEAVYGGPEEWLKGYNPTGKDAGALAPLFAGYFLSQFPFAEQVLADAKTGDAYIPNDIYVLPGFNATPSAEGEQTFVYPRIFVEKPPAKPVPLSLQLLYPPGDKKPWTYQVHRGADRAVLEGEWKADASPDIINTPACEIPVAAPAGSYTVHVGHEFEPAVAKMGWGHGPALMMPVSPSGVREVFSWPRGRYLPPICYQTQLWFQWPAGEKTLTLRFQYSTMADQPQHTLVKNRSGETIWEEEFLGDPSRAPLTKKCTLDRARFGPDGMVQVVFPGPDVRFAVDGTGDLYFAVSPQRWFQPPSPEAAESKNVQNLPVAIVGRSKYRPAVEEALTRDGVRIDKSVTESILNPVDYDQYSAIIFAGAINAGCAWDKPENREAVRQWISNGGIAVVMGLGAVPTIAPPKPDVQSIDEFLGFSAVFNLNAKEGSLVQSVDDKIFQPIPVAQRETGLPWNWLIDGKPSRFTAVRVITSAKPLASIESFGVITVNQIGKGKVYYFACPFPLQPGSVPEADFKAYCATLAAALKP